MPVLILISFVLLVSLLVLVLNGKKRKAKFQAIFDFGQKEFGIELPSSALIMTKGRTGQKLDFMALSDEEGFFYLISPYLGSLSAAKRDFMYQAMNDLKDALRMNKDVYHVFAEEYKIYAGLSEEEAAEKWANQS